MSTDLSPANAARHPMLDQRWGLSPAVALRPEPFGALAYHFGNRRLTFLKTPVLVSLVRGLADQPDVAAALSAAGVPQAQWPAYAEALTRLAAGDMIRPVEPTTAYDPAEQGDDV